MAHARGKAREVADRVGIPEGGAVLGADTEVVLDGVALGKASHPAEAEEMLRSLAGRTHVVMTGLSAGSRVSCMWRGRLLMTSKIFARTPARASNLSSLGPAKTERPRR